MVSVKWIRVLLVVGATTLAGCVSAPPKTQSAAAPAPAPPPQSLPPQQTPSQPAGPLPTPPPAASPLAAGPTAPSGSTAPAVPAKTAKQGGYYDRDGPPEQPANIDLATVSNAVPKAEPLRTSANRPYWLFGQLYTPMTSVTPFKQSGIASWYGKQFHGRKTSTGELYDMFAMTAAHPTLPLPSYVRVTNTRNGKQVIVRVNDRGPFLQNRAIDMSYAAATRLDYIASGHTTVEIELLVPGGATPVSDPLEALLKQAMNGNAVIAEPGETVLPASSAVSAAPKTTASTSVAAQPVYLQLGAFTSRDAADNALRHAQRALPEFENRLVLVDGASLIRLRLGPFDSPVAATEASEKVAQSTGFKPVRVLPKR